MFDPRIIPLHMFGKGGAIVDQDSIRDDRGAGNPVDVPFSALNLLMVAFRHYVATIYIYSYICEQEEERSSISCKKVLSYYEWPKRLFIV